MEIYDFFKAVVNTCNNHDICVSSCPILAIRQNDVYHSCKKTMFDYFIKTDKTVGQKIYDEFVRLKIVEIPNLHFNEMLYKEQLEVLERCCKNNDLEID